jgi:zinc transport system substrate-binding protein
VPKLLLVLLLFVFCLPLSAQERPRVGVTLLPYYSFVANIVGEHAEVIPLIGAGYNPHNYQPQPEDIKGAQRLDALVVNGLGHDQFAFEIVEAAGRKGELPLIFANENVALIPLAGATDSFNSHTFLSISTSVQQVYHIADRLGGLFPAHEDAFRRNARRYALRLRKLKAEYVRRLQSVEALNFRCATIHGGYDYLLQEFGLQVVAVIEPQHGLEPNATQLRATIEEIRRAQVQVVFSQLDFPPNYVETLRRETGVRVRHFSHLADGAYSPTAFEEGMRTNLDTLTSAILEAHQANAAD